MSCQNITLTGLGVGCKDNIGGIKAVYVTEYENVTGFTHGISGKENYITGITLDTGKKFYTFKFRKNTGSMTSEVAVDDAIGTFSVTTNVALQFTKMTTETSKQMLALAYNDLCVLVEDMQNRVWVLGQRNAVTSTAAGSQSGTASTDLNGYTITLSDVDVMFPEEFDSSSWTTWKASNVEDAPVATV